MALKISHEAPTGVTHANAYHHITKMWNNRWTGLMRIYVHIYADQTAKINSKAKVDRRVYTITDDDYDIYFANDVLDVVEQNTVERAYAYLKTLPAYDGAEDV
jgi:hypothetical protein